MAAVWKARAMPDIRDEYLADARALRYSGGKNVMLYRADLEAAEARGVRLPPREADVLRGMRESHAIESALRPSKLYWVTRDMTAVALRASNDQGSFSPAVEMPHEAGFIAFAGGLPRRPHHDPADRLRPDDSESPDVTVRMMTWATVGSRVEVRVLADSRDMSDSLVRSSQAAGIPRPRWFTYSSFAMELETDVENGLSLGSHYQMATMDPAYREQALSSAKACAYLLGTTWHLMVRPTLVEARSLPAAPGKRGRKDQRENRPDVQIIDLRPLREVNTDPGATDASGRKYTHRWYVQAHWRHNVPCGPGKSQRRSVYVEAFIKGPAGAPLLEYRESVSVWRR